MEDSENLVVIDWLWDLGVISESLRKNYKQNPDEFLRELCYGMILPKLAMVTNKNVTYTMVRPIDAKTAGKYLTLDMKDNLQLFFDACKEHGIRKSFEIENLEPSNEKAVNSLFEMLKKLSKKISSKHGPLKTLPKYKSFAAPNKGDEITNNTYTGTNDYNQNEMNVIYAQYISSGKSEGKKNIKSSVFNKVSELVLAEENYATRFLSIMERLINDHLKEYTVLKKLLLSLKIEALIDFHKRFFNQLVVCERNTEEGKHPNVADVFINFKREFLIYAPTVVRCKNLCQTLDLVKIDPAIYNDVKKMEDFLIEERDVAIDFFIPTDFNALLKMPLLHLNHYKTLLIEIRKQTIKDSIGNQLLESCNEALKTIHEILLYITYYSNDSDERALIRRLHSRIPNLQIPNGSLDKSYGQLHYQTYANIKFESESKYEKRYLICFQSMMLICEPQKKNSKKKQNELKFVKAVDVTPNIVVVQNSNPSKSDFTICVHSIGSDGNPLPSESFYLQTTSEKDCKEYLIELDTLVTRKARRPKGEHAFHKFEIFIPENDEEDVRPAIPPRCNLCKMYLFGQLFVGYHCRECKKYFHEDCFMEGRIPTEFRTIEDVEGYSTLPEVKANSFQLEWMMGREEDKSLLKGCEDGTFFIYPCKKSLSSTSSAEDIEYDDYRIIVINYEKKHDGVLVKVPIKSTFENKKRHYRLDLGKSPVSFPDIPSLVEANKERYGLKLPYFKVSRTEKLTDPKNIQIPTSDHTELTNDVSKLKKQILKSSITYTEIATEHINAKESIVKENNTYSKVVTEPEKSKHGKLISKNTETESRKRIVKQQIVDFTEFEADEDLAAPIGIPNSILNQIKTNSSHSLKQSSSYTEISSKKIEPASNYTIIESAKDKTTESKVTERKDYKNQSYDNMSKEYTNSSIDSNKQYSLDFSSDEEEVFQRDIQKLKLNEMTSSLETTKDDKTLPIFDQGKSVGHLLENQKLGTFLIQRSSNEDKPFVIFVKSVKSDTGVIKIKKIFVEKKKVGPDAKLNLEGNGIYFNNIENLISAFSKKFQFPFGKTPIEKLPYYIGIKDHDEADEILRSQKLPFKYVLREKEDGALRLTALNGFRIIHILIEKDPSGKFRMGKFENDSLELLISDYAEEYYK